MSSSSNHTSSPCKSKVEGKVLGSRLIGCVCNLPKKQNLNHRQSWSIVSWGACFWSSCTYKSLIFPCTSILKFSTLKFITSSHVKSLTDASRYNWPLDFQHFSPKLEAPMVLHFSPQKWGAFKEAHLRRAFLCFFNKSKAFFFF